MTVKKIDADSIGGRIRERRKELGLSLEELAFRIGYRSSAAINLMENGKWGISADKLLEISDVLGVNPGWLLGVNKEKIPDDQLGNIIAETISRDQELIEDDRFQSPRDKERMVGELRFARKLASILEGEKAEEGGDDIE